MSTLTFILETDLLILHGNEKFFSVTELVVVVVFTVEIFFKITCCQSLKELFKDFMNVVDILSILPFYIEKILEASGVEVRVNFFPRFVVTIHAS